MRDPALAYLITFRTYGTWLHGDPRGSVDRTGNLYGTPYREPAPSLHVRMHEKLHSSPCMLDDAARRQVEATLREVCGYRNWTLFAVNARSNHVHTVVAASPFPERVMSDFKSWSTRRLVEAGLLSRGERVWARHGSTRYLWSAEAVEMACHYVLHEQD